MTRSPAISLDLASTLKLSSIGSPAVRARPHRASLSYMLHIVCSEGAGLFAMSSPILLRRR